MIFFLTIVTCLIALIINIVYAKTFYSNYQKSKKDEDFLLFLSQMIWAAIMVLCIVITVKNCIEKKESINVKEVIIVNEEKSLE